MNTEMEMCKINGHEQLHISNYCVAPNCDFFEKEACSKCLLQFHREHLD
jgi:hypothetical protein